MDRHRVAVLLILADFDAKECSNVQRRQRERRVQCALRIAHRVNEGELLSQWLDAELVSAARLHRGGPEVTELLAELDAAIYVIDCCPNLSGPETAERTKPLVEQLRKARPETPIVLVEDRVYTDAWLIASKKSRNDGNHAALKKSFDELIATGTKHLDYIPGTDLLGDDNEGAVDSSHPNDLGFMRQADAFDKVLGKMMKE